MTFNLPNSIERISEIAEIFYRYRFNSKIYDVETDLDLKVGRIIKTEVGRVMRLALGDRNSSYYLRIYTIHSALKFELEIKNKTANSLGLLLLNGFYQDFESTIYKLALLIGYFILSETKYQNQKNTLLPHI